MRKRNDWPDNLEAEERNGVVYYRYRDPVTRKSSGLGVDYDRAAKAVRVVNAHRLLKADPIAELVNRIQKPKRTLADHLAWFEQTELTERRHAKTGMALSQETIDGYSNQIKRIRDHFGPNRNIASIELSEVSEFLDALPPTMSNRFRSLMSQIFAHAVAKGYMANNPADVTIKRTETVQRERLTAEIYSAIYEAAEPWFKAAMNLARRSIQRREDLAALKLTQYNDKSRILELQQIKVEGRGYGRLRIAAGEELHQAILQCRDGLLSPFMIHKAFNKKIKADWREHWTQVRPDMLTKEFARLRDETGACKGMKDAAKPTFHEIRAFGAEEMRLAGWDEKAIQLLLGHASAETTALYLDRHKVEWVEARSA